jgi:hypothetical protein
MAPLLQSDITDNINNLTLEHHTKGLTTNLYKENEYSRNNGV